MSELPFKAEYAKSGRASCKACRTPIPQGSLRIAAMLQSAFFDGRQANWYHDTCFFSKQRPKSISEIENFPTLKYDDQKKIEKEIESNASGIVMPEVGKAKGRGKKRSNDSADGALKDFLVEYSKSSRATCKGCDIKITKGEVRICKKVYDTEIGQKYGGQPLWHHVKCFKEDRSNLLFFACGDILPGFNSLTKEDKVMIKSELPALKSDEVPVKKLKEEPQTKEEKKKEDKDERLIKDQNKLFYKYRTALKTHLDKNGRKTLLEYNSQEVPVGDDRILDLLADIMTFGALATCNVCKNGQLRLKTSGYMCGGDLTEWTKCQAVTQEPERTPFKIPKDLRDNDVFKKYKFKSQIRKFRDVSPTSIQIIKIEPELQKNNVDRKVPPLKNLQFFIIGLRTKVKEALKIRILKLGALVPSTISENIAAVISTYEEIGKMSSKMEQAKDLDIQVIEPAFFDELNLDGTVAQTVALISEKNIASWGSDPSTRISQDIIDGKSIPKSAKSLYTKSASSGKTKLTVKGGTAVDPESGLDHEAHVYKDKGGRKYTVVLGVSDIASGKNSFYKLQILKSDTRDKFWLFRAWGRIGTTIGGTKTESMSNLHEAKIKFNELYEDKTGYDWDEDFGDGNRPKIPGKMYPIDIDYSDESAAAPLDDGKSTLPKPTQSLIKLIFDINLMKKVLLEFELDTEKMPLGKLSKNQLKSGYKVLTELENLLIKLKESEDKKSSAMIMDATNRFYTLIPHNFGVDNPPLINSEKQIETKRTMLDNLLDLEIAYTLLQTDIGDTKVSPLDSHYLKLKCEIEPLSLDSPEFEILKKYVVNTHAKTHSNYKLVIEQVFKVNREGEEKRFKPFRKLPNRKLLWHGSRTTNFAGILSRGLQIAPPEAPVTGYMFGKGIYFADMVSKSANYCCPDTTNNVGILLLSEVALGNMHELTKAKNVTKLPTGFNSVKGIGKTEPNPLEEHVLDNGTIVPYGKPVETKVASTLLYNEYIVYDIAQVNLKYLLQMKFKYNY